MKAIELNVSNSAYWNAVPRTKRTQRELSECDFSNGHRVLLQLSPSIAGCWSNRQGTLEAWQLSYYAFVLNLVWQATENLEIKRSGCVLIKRFNYRKNGHAILHTVRSGAEGGRSIYDILGVFDGRIPDQPCYHVWQNCQSAPILRSVREYSRPHGLKQNGDRYK